MYRAEKFQSKIWQNLQKDDSTQITYHNIYLVFDIFIYLVWPNVPRGGLVVLWIAPEVPRGYLPKVVKRLSYIIANQVGSKYFRV